MKKNYMSAITLVCFGFGAVVELVNSFVKYAEIKTRNDTNDILNAWSKAYDTRVAERELTRSIERLNDLIAEYEKDKEKKN
ncbi:MAG: hypothetical protein J6Y02_08885 [Pseudobutyrivibrio sp.]|nr:hypothetical protein [Pseudobutyrivibrio sp.]